MAVLHVDVEGLTTEQRRRAVEAAAAVFASAGVSPEASAAAWFKVESPANEELTPEEDRLATLWEEANAAAAETFRGAGADDIWVLELVPDR